MMPLLDRPASSSRHIVFPVERGRCKAVDYAAAVDLPAAEGPRAEVPWPAGSAEFVRWLLHLLDIDASAYRTEPLARRLIACLRGLRVRTADEARRLLEHDHRLIPKAIDMMLVGVTSFFRDPEVFATLSQTLLPELQRGRAGLYVWSAGCSDGAELYSVGMIFASHGWLPAYLLGTDCRLEALHHARSGWFDASACTTVPALLRDTHLEREGDRFRVSPALRRACRWRVANVLLEPEPGSWDVILCRNTAMYLQPEAAARLWRQLETALRPGGVLVVGKAERPLGSRALEPAGPCLYRRKRGYA